MSDLDGILDLIRHGHEARPLIQTARCELPHGSHYMVTSIRYLAMGREDRGSAGPVNQ